MTMLNVIANAYKVPLILSDAGKCEAIAVKLLERSTDDVTNTNRLAAKLVVVQIAALGHQLDPVIGGYEPDARSKVIEALSTSKDRDLERRLASDLLDRVAKYLAKNPSDVGNPAP